MARTKASVGAKVASGKSSKARCSVAPPSTNAGGSGSGDKSSRNTSGGGNSVCPRETPKWQKPITNFFVCKDKSNDSDEDVDNAAGSSKSKPKHNVIESDDEETQSPKAKQTIDVSDDEWDEPATNTVLDETIDLEPLNGDDSHKIEEYYSKNSKGKGKGKKTKDKENIDNNVEKRNSVKRDLEEVTIGEESPHVSKKVKVN